VHLLRLSDRSTNRGARLSRPGCRPSPAGRAGLFSLLVANGVILVVTLASDRGYFAPLVVFWLEALVLGFYNIGKMLVVATRGEPFGRWGRFENAFAAGFWVLASVVFFAVELGGFVLGVGFLIGALPALFDRDAGGLAVLEALQDNGSLIFAGVAVVAVSHGISFVANFLGRREYRRTNLLVLLVAPYLRILGLLGAITAAFAVALALHSLRLATAFTVGLVLIKTLVDLVTHLLEHRLLRG